MNKKNNYPQNYKKTSYNKLPKNDIKDTFYDSKVKTMDK